MTAFDTPLEADRVDDFGLLTMFVRAPLWILGGVLGARLASQSEDENDSCAIIQKSKDTNNDNNNGVLYSANNGEISISKIKDDKDSKVLHNMSEPIKRVPASTTISKSINGVPANGMKRRERVLPSVITGTIISSSYEEYETSGLQRAKKMSWSDESGQSLVEYLDESKRSVEPISSAASAAKPVRSAMRRSRSERAGALATGNSVDGTRYIPKMNSRPENSLVMPTRPYNTGTVNSNGVESPQWGWYINTTPPTPEMYHSQPRLQTATSQQTLPPPSSSTVSAQPVADMTAAHNPIFQNIQVKHKKSPMGWTSVPI